MCVAYSGKVIELHPRTATVDFHGNLVEARTGLVDVNVGDRVLVHAGCILQKVSEQEALELDQLMEETGGTTEGNVAI